MASCNLKTVLPEVEEQRQRTLDWRTPKTWGAEKNSSPCKPIGAKKPGTWLFLHRRSTFKRCTLSRGSRFGRRKRSKSAKVCSLTRQELQLYDEFPQWPLDRRTRRSVWLVGDAWSARKISDKVVYWHSSSARCSFPVGIGHMVSSVVRCDFVSFRALWFAKPGSTSPTQRLSLKT